MKKINLDFTIRIPSTIRLNIWVIVNSKEENSCIIRMTSTSRLISVSTVQYSICSSLSTRKKGDLAINQKLARNTFYTSISKKYFFHSQYLTLITGNTLFTVVSGYEALCISFVIHQTSHIC